MAEPFAGEGFEFGRWLHLKQNWSAVYDADGSGVDSPGGGGGGRCTEEDESTDHNWDRAAPGPPGFALAGQPRRLSPREFFAIRGLHFTSVALYGIAPLHTGMRIRVA